MLRVFATLLGCSLGRLDGSITVKGPLTYQLPLVEARYQFIDDRLQSGIRSKHQHKHTRKGKRKNTEQPQSSH